MKIPRSLINAILLLIFAGAVWIRIDGPQSSSKLYYKGESAMNYRYALMISEKGSLPEVDQKVSWPEGLSPAKTQARGVEFLTGYLYRFFSYFSDTSFKDFTRGLTVLVFSLLVFVLYRISYKVWRCKAGAVLSSSLVAFSAPVIAATNGGEYTHIPFAVTAMSLHALVLLDRNSKPVPLAAVMQAAASFILMAFWEFAIYYFAATAIFLMLTKVVDHGERIRILITDLVAVLAAGILLPHASAAMILATPPALILYASILAASSKTLTSSRLATAAATAAIVIPGAVLLHIFSIYSPDALHGMNCFYQRILHPAGKPADPEELSLLTRYIWTRGSSPPSGYDVWNLFVPLGLMIPALIDGLRAAGGCVSKKILKILLIAGAASAIYLADRAAAGFTAAVLFVIISPVFYSFFSNFRKRIVFIAAGLILMFMQGLPFQGDQDMLSRLGRLAGAGADKERFNWVGIGNSDLELVEHIAARTSTKDPFLCTPDVSSFLLAFTGRTTALYPGIVTEAASGKLQDMFLPLYGGEEALYEVCKSSGIKYVLYSIDMVLDGSRYSPSYTAAVRSVDRESAAWLMHFFPESLEHLQLVYENDNYRLFKVVEEGGPIFLSDHPPVYQHTIFKEHGNNTANFYQGIIRILSIYAMGANAQSGGNLRSAAGYYLDCLYEAPRFTEARLALGSTWFNLKEFARAKEAYESIIRYSPDDPKALFGAALAASRLNNIDEARSYLDLIFSATSDRYILRKARGLEKILNSRGGAQNEE